MDVNFKEILLAAVEAGDLGSVRNSLNQFDLDNFDDGYAYGLLCKSITFKHTEITKLILISGFGPNLDSYSEWLPRPSKALHFAVKNGDTEIVKELLDYDAEMEKSIDKDYWTPLHHAVDMNNEEIVDLLTTRLSDDIYIPDISPLHIHIAVENGYYKMTEKLLKLGFDVDSPSNANFSPLHCAVKKGHTAIVELLLKYKAKVNTPTDAGLTPLHFASENGNIELIKLLLSYNADVNAGGENMFNVAPLYLAVKNSHEEAARYLMAYGASIEGEFKNGEMAALENLFQEDFCVKPDDINDTALLHTAISLGYIKIIEDLIKHGLDLACNKAENYNILHIAVKYKQVEIAKLLLTHGVNVNTTDKDGKPALYYATKNLDVTMAKLLLSNGANVNEKNPELLWDAIRRECTELAEIYIYSKIDIEATAEDGRNALHLSIWYNSEDIVKLLLSNGANVNARSKSDKKTPLHIACEIERHNGIQRNIVEKLFEYKAEVNSRDDNGKTPLHLAFLNKYEDIVQMLLNAGADINILDNNGNSVYEIYYFSSDEMEMEVMFQTFDDENYNVVFKVLRSHLIMLKAANFYIRKKDLLLMNYNWDDSTRLHATNCEDEIKKLKQKKIAENINLCFYDILTKGINSLASYARNEDIIEVFKSNNYKLKFPIYSPIMERNFTKGIERHRLFERAREFLKYCFELPNECYDQILKYLNNDDLENIINL